ncbi:MAG: CinA family nicotinamide mononucleotide deamidase-related protein [Thermodesulfobacteriota bacterium]
MRGEIIAIGDELTTGRILNTTSFFAASQLFAAGHEVLAMTTIGDEVELIGQTIRQALSRADFLIVTGGLGPTTDDLTNLAVSAALDRPATFHPEIFRKIADHGRNNRPEVQSALEKLAWLPAGAHALHTEAKTAGYFLVQHGKPIFFLPGVPHEMKELLLETVLTRLAVWEGEEGRQVRQKVYKVVGLAESEINTKLEHLEDGAHGVRIGYYPVFPEVHVSLTVAGNGDETIDQRFYDLDTAISDILGRAIYGCGTDSLEGVVGRLLGWQGKTLAVAESCSGGLMAHKVTRVSGSSAYFLGGVVAYSNDLKKKLLGVPADTLTQYGAVSSETARAMAEGIRRVTGADLGVSITGIAGPSGGSEAKPVGTVSMALATAGGTDDHLLQLAGDRWQIQEHASQLALDMVRRSLLDSE